MEMVMRSVTSAALLALLLPGIAAAQHHHGVQVGVRSLDVYADGSRIHLLTGVSLPDSDKSGLLHRVSTDGGESWSEPVRIDAKMPSAHSLHRGMDAQIAAAGDRLVAAWTTPGTDRWGSGPIAIAVSTDGGKSWKAGQNPADDGSTTGHGFIDIAADRHGTFHITWLDSRDGKQGLRYTQTADPITKWAPNLTVKAGTCECCSNALATGADGAVAILFRDNNPRDMHLALSSDAGATWGTPMAPVKFGWQFNGCPHVGGAVAIQPGKPNILHTAVWTGADDRAGLYYVRSDDRAGRWLKPHRLGGPRASHPDLATGPTGIVAVWDESRDGITTIQAATSADDGATWSRPVQLSTSTASPSHPRVIATANGFRAFWTETQSDGTSEWRSAIIPIKR